MRAIEEIEVLTIPSEGWIARVLAAHKAAELDRERKAAADAAKLEQQLREQAGQKADHFREHLASILGVNVPVAPGQECVKLDRYTFTDAWNHLELRETCAACGEEGFWTIKNLADAGRAIKDIGEGPWYCSGECRELKTPRPAEDPTTLAERAISEYLKNQQETHARRGARLREQLWEVLQIEAGELDKPVAEIAGIEFRLKHSDLAVRVRCEHGCCPVNVPVYSLSDLGEALVKIPACPKANKTPEETLADAIVWLLVNRGFQREEE